MIAAVAENGIIGHNNTMPWRQRNDLLRFKRLTLGHPIVMGRKTFESIGSKPLVKRQNIVLSSQPPPSSMPKHLSWVHTWDEAFSVAYPSDIIYIIGGGQIYKKALPMATHMEITYIHARIEGTTHFVEIDGAEWLETRRERFDKDQTNQYDYSFVSLERRK